VDATGRVAVLAVVIAGVVALMVEKGAYTWGNTVFGLTLLVLLRSYDAPRDRDPSGEREAPLQTVAYGAALALCIMNISGPFQEYFLEYVTLFPTWGVVAWKELFGWLPLKDLSFFAVWLVLTIVAFRIRRYRRFRM
jgi:hypothetical protein